jgi:hypothetical protein
MPERSSKSERSLVQGSWRRFSVFRRERTSPAFSLSCQKSCPAVVFSISSICFLRAAGSKTPPGFFDLGAEGLELRFEFA